MDDLYYPDGTAVIQGNANVEALQAYYPGFVITCLSCKSTAVGIDGGWDGVHIVCSNCGEKTTIWEVD